MGFQVQGLGEKEENKGISEKAQSFWERRALFVPVGTDLVKCLFFLKEMPLE